MENLLYYIHTTDRELAYVDMLTNELNSIAHQMIELRYKNCESLQLTFDVIYSELRELRNYEHSSENGTSDSRKKTCDNIS